MKVSICVPVFDGEETLKQLYDKTLEAFSETPFLFEILFAFDFGKEESWRILKQLKEKDPGRVKIFHLLKNYGQHKALIFCISKSCGDLLITMDEDLQHNPADILFLIDKQIIGDYDVVYGNYVDPNHSFIRNFTSSTIRKIMIGSITGLYKNFSPFRLIKREVAIRLGDIKPTYDFIDAKIGNLTNNITDIYVNHFKSEKRKSTYTWYKLARHLLAIIINYTRIIKITYLFSLAIIGLSVMLYLLSIKYNGLWYKTLSIILGVTGTIIFIIGILLQIIKFNNSKYIKEKVKYFVE
jgi:undecaprenyl-phosphate 4-deoxy-4-formamido-L-arabinose transferase